MSRALLLHHPHEGMLWKVLSVALVRQGKDALLALRRAAELMPMDAEAHSTSAPRCMTAGSGRSPGEPARRARHAAEPCSGFRRCGRCAEGARAAEESVALYQRALQLHPGSRRRLTISAMHSSSSADMRRRRHAIGTRFDRGRMMRRFSAISATRSVSWRTDEALSSTRQALALDPTLALAHNNLGLMLRPRGDASKPRRATAGRAARSPLCGCAQ